MKLKLFTTILYIMILISVFLSMVSVIEKGVEKLDAWSTKNQIEKYDWPWAD